ncbi:hypothetical protein CHS0354_003526 [Potamilus streckersoni]|uniref:Ras-associating domain-containing protein n=1 Tax=Potamilus streckersoni TaxID=2493646 RepID=A0AAE0SB85_9BIVA|nr:hypothetical protein CHS0354_003526 [Potamilus streckersoni]
MQTISVLVDGRNCYQKVTKNTTCGDVIQHLLKDSGLNIKNKDSYYLSASNNITEQQLSNKIKVLKVAEDLAFGTNRLHFILRKKIHLPMSDVSAMIQKRLGEKSSAKELKFEKVEPVHYAPVRAPKKSEALSGYVNLCRSRSVGSSNIDDPMTLKCKFDRNSVDHANDTLDEKLNTIINELRHCTFNTAEYVEEKDILIVEDEDPGSFVNMSSPFRQSVTGPNLRRIRGNEIPIPSCLLENKTMSYLLRSRKRTPMMRQIEAMQLAFDKLTYLQLQEIPGCDNYFSRGTDEALSELISQRKPTFSREEEGCKHFCQHGYVSKSDENLHYDVLDKELDEVIDSTSDVSINSSNHSASSLHVITGNMQSNERDHSVLSFDSNSRVMSNMQDSQYANDSLRVQTLKMKLVDYSLSDSDISSVAGESA